MTGVPLRVRIAGVVVAALVVVVLACLTVAVAVDRAATVRRDIDGRLQPAAGDARALERALVDQETGERGFIITGDRTFLQPYDMGRRQERATTDRLREAFAGDAPLLAMVEDAEAAAEAWRAAGPTPEVRARAEGRTRLAQRLVADGRGKEAFDQVRQVQERLVAAIESRIVTAEDRAAQSERFLRDVLLATTLVLLLLVLAIGLLLRQWLLVPIEDLRRSLRRVAGGDLGAPVTTHGPPEVVAIGADAEAMRRRLLTELDNSRAAVEAMEVQSPALAAVRRELTAVPTTHLPGVTVAGAIRAAEGVIAGDWWQTVTRPSGRLAVVVADVSGHGAMAGLVALRFHQRVTTLLRTDLDLAALFSFATADLDTDPERFVTCLLLELDPATRRVRHLNAGHPAGLVVPEHGEVRQLEPTGPVVSVLGGEWSVEETTLEVGELVVAVTDGVLEARSAGGADFAEEGVLEVLGRRMDRTPEHVVEELHAAVRDHAGGERQDDVTVVVARFED